MDPIIDRIINYQSKELNDLYRKQDYDYSSNRKISNMEIIHGLEKLGKINPKYVCKILELCDLINTTPTSFYIYKKMFKNAEEMIKYILKNTEYENHIDCNCMVDLHNNIWELDDLSSRDNPNNEFDYLNYDSFGKDLLEKFIRKCYKRHFLMEIKKLNLVGFFDNTDEFKKLVKYYLDNYEYKKYTILEFVDLIINDLEFQKIHNRMMEKYKQDIIKKFNNIMGEKYELEEDFVEYLDNTILDTLKNRIILRNDF